MTTLNLSSSSRIVCEQSSRLVTVTTVRLPCHGTNTLVWQQTMQIILSLSCRNTLATTLVEQKTHPQPSYMLVSMEADLDSSSRPLKDAGQMTWKTGLDYWFQSTSRSQPGNPSCHHLGNESKPRQDIWHLFGLISPIPGLLYGFFLCFSFFSSSQLSLFPSVLVFLSYVSYLSHNRLFLDFYFSLF